MKDRISDSTYKQIEQMIASDESVVGIDAKKTHILILHKLMELEERIGQLEKTLKQGRSTE